MGPERDELTALLAVVDRMLWEDWDPIGVNEIPEARDEYESYVPGVVQLIRQATSAADVFRHLWWLETVYMGLGGDRSRTQAMADRLFALRRNPTE